MKGIIPTSLLSEVTFKDQDGRQVPLMTRRQSSLVASALFKRRQSRFLEKLMRSRDALLPKLHWARVTQGEKHLPAS